MTDTIMNNGPPRSLLWSAIRLVLKGLFYCWLGRALYVFVYDDFVASHGLLARSYLAGRDGLRELPDTLAFLAGLVGSGIAWLHGTLVGELGYDPVVLPDLTPQGAATFAPGLAAVLQPALQLGLALSAAQFALLFLIAGRRGALGWTAPGVPLILEARFRLVYWAATLGLSGALVWLALAQGLLAALAAALVALACLRLPLLGALPLWLLDKGFGLSPRLLLRLPVMIGRGLARLVAGNLGAQDGRRRGSARGDGGFDRAAGAGWEEEAFAPPEAQDTARRYESACASFELAPGGFEEAELRGRYRELMKKVHPDSRGSARLAQLINADYEFVLQHHGWKR